MSAERKRDIQEIVAAAERADWQVVRKRAGYQFRSPDGSDIYVLHSSGGSDWRAIKNARAFFRRHGLRV